MLSTIGTREIRAFLALAEELNFRRAAERLEVTPSRVSQTIRLLETHLGGQLFERTSHQTRLTPLGGELARNLGPAQQQVDRALALAYDAATGIAGTLRLGMYSPLNGGPHLLEIVREFQADHPDCTVKLIETGFERDQLDWLRTDDADLLAIRLPLTGSGITIGPTLSSEERVLAVATGHPLAQRDSVTVDDIAPFAVTDIPTLPREMVDAFVPRQTPSGKPLRRIPVTTASAAHVLMLVALGDIVHPTVPSFLGQNPRPDVTSVAMTDLPRSQTALIWLSDTPSPKVLAFAEVARRALARSGCETT